MNIANKLRRALIYVGKALPFILCFLVSMTYCEELKAIISDDFLCYHDCTLLNTPISYFIANHFEYDIMTIIVASIISIAIETCVWNKLAIFYLALHLLMKDIITFEVELWQAYIIIIANLIVSSLLTLKGINIGYRNLRCIAR